MRTAKTKILVDASREADRRLFVENYFRKHPDAWEDWDEDKTLPKPVLMLRGASYKPSLLFDVEPHRDRGGNYIVSPGGHFAYANRILVPFRPLALLYRHYQVVFDAECVLPTLIDLRIDDHGVKFPPGMTEAERAARGAVWMSLTPGEMMSQREGIRRAKNKVVIGGLGLGWFFEKVANKKEVSEVIVVEKSKELLDWYGETICNRFPKASLIWGDVWKEIGRHGPCCQYLLDVWTGWGNAEHDRKLKAAKRRVGAKNIWAWGEHIDR